MIFEEALGVDDDYVRLQKISEGIKQIAQTLKTSKTFQSSVLLKQSNHLSHLVFCSYPFAEEQIEQLLDECFEQYKNDGKFVLAIHKAIQEVASLQEYRQFLGTRSIFSRQNSKLLNNNNITATLKEQIKQGSIPFSREVVERLIIAKQFSIKFIKPIFVLSQEYKFDLEQLAQIFKVFLQHTKNEEFQQKIIDVYEDLKLNVFKDKDWIEQFNQDLEDYFVQNKLRVPPKLIQSKLSHIKSKNKKILQQHYKKQSLKHETESDSQSNSPGQPLIIDYKKRIQQWLCNKEIQQIDLDSYIFITNSENFNTLISFIVNPSKIDLIDDWQQEFENEEDCHNVKNFKNVQIQLNKYQVFRSFKATMVISELNNLKQIDKILTTFIENIFRRIYESIINDEINLNLNHLIYLIEQLLLFNSQKSVHQILEYNLLFTLSLYIYNNNVSTFIGEIISLWIDRFKLGYYVQEQIWKYLDYTNWFSFFFSIMIKQQQRNDQCYKEYKSLKIDGILAFVKLLKSPEKTLQTQTDQQNSITSRQDPVTPIEFSEEQQILNSSQWFLDNNYTANQIMEDASTKDFDNLKKFHTEKNKSQASEQESPLRIKLFQSSYSKGFYTYANSSQKSSQSIISPKNRMNNSSISLPSIDIKLQKSESVDSQQCQNYLTRQRNKTYIVSQDGFSTTKLVSIYPRRNIDLQFTNFEITKHSFNYNKYAIKGSLQVIKMIIESIFNMLNYQENIIKDNYQRQQFLSLSLRQFLTEKTILTIYKVFLYGLFDDQNKLLAKLSAECGQIIFIIYNNGLNLRDKNLNLLLKNCFDQTVDYLVKKIIELNNYPLITEFKFIQHQLTSILVTGLQLYDIYNPDKDDRNIFRNLNETVMHICIIWFFNSHQNNQFQLNFVKLIAILFSKAPQYQLQNLLFHVGLLTSLFNGFNSYNKNGCKNIEYVESLYMNLTYLIYIIHTNIYYRQLDSLIQNLESSQSWKGLQSGIPTVESSFLRDLLKLMNIENKDYRKTKINMKFNSLPSSKGTNRNANEEKIEISQMNETLKQKQLTKDNSSSPVKQQVQIKKLIRYRTKNSIKA